MKISGLTDEAGQSIDTQIKALQELEWQYMSSRSVDGTNLHNLSEEKFDEVVEKVNNENISVIEFGSLLGNWSKNIDSDFTITLQEIERIIPRAHRLGTKLIRVMSYGQNPWGEDQQEAERFRRLKEITSQLTQAGLTPVHENCMNWGGFSPQHTLRLIEEIPGLKLVFDTGNPIFQRDRSLPEPYPWQDALSFYQQIKEHVIHVHVKDCLHPLDGETEPEKYTLPGEGLARIPEILQALKADNYDGFFTIEPHVATVFHAKDEEVDHQQCYDSFVEYGHAMVACLKNNFLTQNI